MVFLFSVLDAAVPEQFHSEQFPCKITFLQIAWLYCVVAYVNQSQLLQVIVAYGLCVYFVRYISFNSVFTYLDIHEDPHLYPDWFVRVAECFQGGL